MKPGSLVQWLSIIGVTALLMGAASAADVHVMISAGFYEVYFELGPAFERASGHHLVTTRGGNSHSTRPRRDRGRRDSGWRSRRRTRQARIGAFRQQGRARSFADRHGGPRRGCKARHQQRRGTPEHAAGDKLYRVLG